ncbi:hypothetical protein B0H14DRAFT_3444140 [Mycena olivaceomarginata]|nr:hypothetical protein B0H14DRAFT_3444140 [Mycena olivaceomarginata]
MHPGPSKASFTSSGNSRKTATLSSYKTDSVPAPPRRGGPTHATVTSSSGQEDSVVDSRVYSGIRLRSYHGYQRDRIVDTSMDLRLPEFSSYHSRVVLFRGHQYLIWSPNSLQDPYYPGCFVLAGRPGRAADERQRRYDSHNGRSDYIKVPQVFHAERPWLGFIFRESKAPAGHVEYEPAYSVWESEDRTRGRIRASYVEQLTLRNHEMDRFITYDSDFDKNIPPAYSQNAPKYPDDGRVRDLLSISSFENAVDEIMDVQRGMREKWAWIEMVGHLKRTRLNPPTASSIPSADDCYLGVWLNGTLHQDCAWLIHDALLPGFVLSELPDYIPVQEDALANFYQRTEIEKFVLVPEACEYDRLALAKCYQWTTAEFHPVSETPAPRNPGAWASIYVQLGIMPERRLVLPHSVVKESDSSGKRSLYEQLVNGPLYAGSASALPPSKTSISDAPASSWCGATSPPPVTRSSDNLPRTQKVESDDSDPRIADVSSGAWSCFREKTEMTDAGEDKTFMMKLGKANSESRVEDGESLWYDRENRRKLIFESLPPLEEGEWLMTDEEYGRPVPDWSFRAPYGSGYSSTKKSLWMYPRERPNPGTKGQELPVPEVEDLPLKNPGEGGEPFRDVKGAWARREDSDEDRQIGDRDPDAVSIGSPTPARLPLASMEGVESVPTPPPYKSFAAVTLIPPTAPRLLPRPYDQVLARSAEVPFMPPSTSYSTPVAPARRSNDYRPLQPSSHSLYARQGQLGAPAGPYRSGHPDAPRATQFAPMGATDSTGWEGDVDGLVGGGEEECRGRCRVETSIMRLRGKNGALSRMHLEVGTRPQYDKFVLLTRLRHRPLLDMSMLGPPTPASFVAESFPSRLTSFCL